MRSTRGLVRIAGMWVAFDLIPGRLPFELESQPRNWIRCSTNSTGLILPTTQLANQSVGVVVVLWGDHGWNLGEHTLWCKHSCYETSMQIPVIVRAPGIQGGERRSGPVESIDLYPTLCELAGLPLPEHLQGRSLATLMKDPEAEWKSAAMGRYQNGDTIRTDAFRFTQYTNQKGEPTSQMLYDHHADPDENVNVVTRHKDAVHRLTNELHRLKGRDEE